MVNFINTAPLYEIWQQRQHGPDWVVTEGPPSLLNRMLFLNELDLGFVSSHEYAIRPERYQLLSDLSISASGRVGSVFLFADRPLAELDGQLILLSSQSQTSASLVRILLEEFYRIVPRYVTGEITGSPGLSGRPAAVLAIGDQALRLAVADEYALKVDLGELWQQQTGLPFVFAVWAVRADFAVGNPEAVRAVHQELRECLRLGQEHLPEISRQVAARIPMSPEACFSYLRGIEYDLGVEKRQGLRRFIEMMTARGEASPAALPLRLIT